MVYLATSTYVCVCVGVPKENNQKEMLKFASIPQIQQNT